MGKSFLPVILICVTCVSLQAQQQTQYMGVRIGDPIGVTYKKFVRADRSMEFIFGTAARNWKRNYYENSFYDYDLYEGYSYQSHKVLNSIYLQGRYLFQNTIPVDGMDGKLQWYAGMGAMLKFSRVDYKYYDNSPDNILLSNVRSNIDFGPEGIGGVEYYFEDIPLAVFGETSLLFELADRPLTLQLFGAVGARLSF